MQPFDPTAQTLTAVVNRGYITRSNKLSASKEIHFFVRLHRDLCNVPLYVMQGFRLHIRLPKAQPSIHMMNKAVESKNNFKALDAQLLFTRIIPNPFMLTAHNSTLSKGGLVRYNLTRVELKTSIDNAVLVPIPKRLLFTMVKNTDIMSSLDINPYRFQH